MSDNKLVDILLLYWREISSLGLITLLTFIYRNRPKISSERVEIDYIDDSTKYRWMEKVYDIEWGPIFFLNKLFICKTVEYADIEIYCSPINSFLDLLTPNCYTISNVKNHKKVFLKNRRYFKENDIRNVKITVRYPILKKYRDNIETDIISNVLLIKNNNRFIIKNYIYTLTNIEYLEGISRHHNLIDLICIESTTPNFINIYDKRISDLTLDLVKIKTIINEIPPKVAGEMVQLSIPLG